MRFLTFSPKWGIGSGKNFEGSSPCREQVLEARMAQLSADEARQVAVVRRRYADARAAVDQILRGFDAREVTDVQAVRSRFSRDTFCALTAAARHEAAV